MYEGIYMILINEHVFYEFNGKLLFELPMQLFEVKIIVNDTEIDFAEFMRFSSRYRWRRNYVTFYTVTLYFTDSEYTSEIQLYQDGKLAHNEVLYERPI